MKGILILVCGVFMVTLGSWEGYKTHESIPKTAIPVLGVLLAVVGIPIAILEAEAAAKRKS